MLRFQVGVHWKNGIRHSLSKTKCFQKLGNRRVAPAPQANSSDKSDTAFIKPVFLWSVKPEALWKFVIGDYRVAADEATGLNSLRWVHAHFDDRKLYEAFWQRVATDFQSFLDRCARSLVSVSPTTAPVASEQLGSARQDSLDSLQPCTLSDCASPPRRDPPEAAGIAPVSTAFLRAQPYESRFSAQNYPVVASSEIKTCSSWPSDCYYPYYGYSLLQPNSHLSHSCYGQSYCKHCAANPSNSVCYHQYQSASFYNQPVYSAVAFGDYSCCQQQQNYLDRVPVSGADNNSSSSAGLGTSCTSADSAKEYFT